MRLFRWSLLVFSWTMAPSYAQGPTGYNMQSDLMAACARGLLPQSLCQAQSSFGGTPPPSSSSAGSSFSNQSPFGAPSSSNTNFGSPPSMGYSGSQSQSQQPQQPSNNAFPSSYPNSGPDYGNLGKNAAYSNPNVGWMGPTTPSTLDNVRSGFGNGYGNANWASNYNSNTAGSRPSSGYNPNAVPSSYGQGYAANNNNGYSTNSNGYNTNQRGGYGYGNGLSSLSTSTPSPSYFNGQNDRYYGSSATAPYSAVMYSLICAFVVFTGTVMSS